MGLNYNKSQVFKKVLLLRGKLAYNHILINENMHQIICDAIQNHQILEFEHDGHHRIVEPFTLGMTTKNKVVLSAYQIGGTSGGRDVPGWGQFSLEKMSDLKVLDQKFLGNREGYRRSDRRMIHIYSEV